MITAMKYDHRCPTDLSVASRVNMRERKDNLAKREWSEAPSTSSLAMVERCSIPHVRPGKHSSPVHSHRQ